MAWTNGSNDGGSSETFADVDVNDDKEWSGRAVRPAVRRKRRTSRCVASASASPAPTRRRRARRRRRCCRPTARRRSRTFFRYRTGTTPTLADGERTRIAPQFYYYVGPLRPARRVHARCRRTSRAGHGYRRAARDTLDTTAWQLQASWFLTGEEESFRGFKPNNVFSLANNTWGAFELVARYHELDPDDDAFVGGAASFADPAISARKATAYGLGLNWYLNENLKWVLNYEQTSFDGGAAGRRGPRRREGVPDPLCTRLLNGERNMSTHRFLKALAAPALLAALLLTRPRTARGNENPAQRVLRPDARALPGLQHGLRQALEGEDRQGRRRSSQSHGGSGKQARAVIDGLEADVVTLALAYDIDALATQGKLLPADWQKRLPHNSSPYTSTIVFLVRKGNPKGIKDWGDLAQARRLRHHAEPEDLGRRALELPRGLGLRAEAAGRQRRRRPRTSSASSSRTCRCSTPARAARPRPSSQRGIGDVLLAWENEAFLALKELGPDKFEIVAPSLSILAEPPVAVVDKVVDKHGTTARPRAYLEYLYSPEGQEIAAQALLPPARPGGRREVRERSSRRSTLFTIDGLRRLGQGAEDALRRRRHLRPDLRPLTG